MPSERPSWAPLLAVCAGYFMVILDVRVINVAVPVIGWELSASLTGVALGGGLLASAADYGTGIRVSMLVGALAYLAAAGLAWRCVPAGPRRPGQAGKHAS